MTLQDRLLSTSSGGLALIATLFLRRSSCCCTIGAVHYPDVRAHGRYLSPRKHHISRPRTLEQPSYARLW
jgi:hypothetical protein